MLRLVLFSFSLLLASESFGQQQAINAIKKGDANALSTTFTEEVDISFNDQGDQIPKAEAGKMLQTFLTNNKAVSYSTSHSEIDRIWGQKKHIIFDIDVQGALALKKKFDESCLTIFIKPPSKELLMERLINRKTDSPDSIQKRIIKAEHELKFEPLFDFILFNDSLDVACTEAELVVRRFLLPINTGL